MSKSFSPEQIALILGSTAVDGTASSKSYVAIAKDTKKGAFIGIRPLGPAQLRLRMMPLTNLEISNWKNAFPDFNWTKSSDIRKSLVDHALLEKPEGGTESDRLSFKNARLASRLAAALEKRLNIEDENVELLVDLHELSNRIIDYWASMLGYGDSEFEQLERLKDLQACTPDPEGHIQKKIDDMIEAFGGEPPEINAPPATVMKDFFEQPSKSELEGSAGNTEGPSAADQVSDVVADETPVEEAKSEEEQPQTDAEVPDNVTPLQPPVDTADVKPENPVEPQPA